MSHKHSQEPKIKDNPTHSHSSWIWNETRIIRSTQDVFSTSEHLQVSAWKHPSVSVRFFKQLKTPCTVRGLLTWSHKRHLFLVSQYWKMTSSCIFFSFYYIGHIWPAYQVDQPHSQIADSILGGEWFLPCWNIWKVLKTGKLITSQNTADLILKYLIIHQTYLIKKIQDYSQSNSFSILSYDIFTKNIVK